MWIVADWGGIRRNLPATIDAYLDELGDLSAQAVERFITGRDSLGISSWSKIVALAHPDDHAIYDARTSVGLNCALIAAGSCARFAMPPSQNRVMKAAAAEIRVRRKCKGIRGGWLAYRDYINLLKAMVQLNIAGAPRSVLHAEMKIFASAPHLARRLLDWEPAAASSSCRGSR
jgi:hypothetical protein